jgi:hypothetical protein
MQGEPKLMWTGLQNGAGNELDIQSQIQGENLTLKTPTTLQEVQSAGFGGAQKLSIICVIDIS